MRGVPTKVAGVIVIIIGILCLFVQGHLEGCFARLALTSIAFGLFSGGANLIKIGERQLQPRADELLARDTRLPVLLLRSFARDHDEIAQPFSWSGISMLSPEFYMKRTGKTPEEHIAWRLAALGPVVALGRPEESLQPLGASRLYAPHDEWKDRFRSLISKAALIVMIVDDSDSLRWELSEIKRTHNLSRLMFVFTRRAFKRMPHQKEQDLELWEALRQEFSFLPPVLADVVAITFNAAGSPRTFRGVGAAITAYAEREGI